ncbi:heavy metal translocating P-type ATPase [Flavobacterium pectinovorum]|uniref:Cadmium-translocating P-type ATPase n=1 Tax=Flavobacterium pectinovorum TaxID=29533 RepID=A0A502F1R1_9FLAO|nr:heavy metal translocating P-type ATPase [Flavobacterium pectinovorum]TPG44108.1 cadmium-translocating P-type ATPase [Flavobacterium pectinovorum]
MKETAIYTQVSEELSFVNWERHGQAIVTGLCLLFIGLAWWAGKSEISVAEISLYILAYIVGGYQKAKEGLDTLFKEKQLDVDLLMVVAAIGAASIGYWMDGAILIFIFSLSGALESYTMERTDKAIESIMKLRPEEAVLFEDGAERTVKVEQLKKGDVIIVRPGDRIAADGIIIEGYSAINQASITGEAIPVDKKNNDVVFSGTINGQGALQIEVTKSAEDTMLAKIIHLVHEAQKEKPPIQLFVERFEGIYAKFVIISALVLMTLPHYIFSWTWSETIYRAMIFLVVASPCALVSSIMPATLSAISNAARKGVLFKGGVHLENIADIKVVAFDKTGTLTSGKPKVMDIVPLQNTTEIELLQVAASIETLSQHPIAKAIVQAAKERNVALKRPKELQAIHGLGVHGSLDGISYRIGKVDILDDISLLKDHLEKADELENQGKTVIFVAVNQKLIGLLSIVDTIRPEAKKVIDELKAMGIKVALLTGDSKTTGNAVGKQTGIDEIYTELLPEQKVGAIKKLESKYGKTAMVGDGVNDAPALASASVGIAMGGAGTDVAMETADIILMSDNIENIPFAISLGKRTNRVVKQNIVFAIGVALTLVTMNFLGGIINLPEGVIGHEGSTVLVILSGLRLLR